MKKTLILLLFIVNNIYSNNDKIEIRNFGIISIGSGNNYVGKHLWKLSFSYEDSLFNFYIKSKKNEKYIFFNLSKLLNIKILKYLSENETNYTFKKDDKIIFSIISKINLTPKNLFSIYSEKTPEIIGLKGKIIDSYALKNLEDKYFFTRTIINNKLLCWYIIKNNKIMNIHTENYNPKFPNIGRITITNFFDKKNPEYTFKYVNENSKKIIVLGEKSKYITSTFKNKFKISPLSKNYNQLEYQGFVYYNNKNNG